MLTRFHKILGAVLAVQILLAVIIHLRGDDRAIAQEQPMLIGFDAAKVTRVQIINDSKTLDLMKTGTTWAIANGFNYPVAAGKVDDALAPLAKLTAGTPMATQKSRHKQLAVDDHEFGSKVTLTVDGKDITLFVGSSIGARRVAVRRAGEDAVYGVTNISQGTFTGHASRWVDDKYIAIERDQIASVIVEHAGAFIEVAKSTLPATPDGKPTYSAAIDNAALVPAAGQQIASSVIDNAFNAVSSLTMDEPGDPKRNADNPTATVTVTPTAKDGAQPAPPLVVIDIVVDGPKAWVHQRGLPHAILLDKSRVDALLSLTKDKLVQAAAAPTPAPAGQPGGLPPGITQEMLQEALQKQGMAPPQ